MGLHALVDVFEADQQSGPKEDLVKSCIYPPVSEYFSVNSAWMK